MKSAELRNAFLNFFESKQHTIVKSSSLVPANDPTLLFTNAGMNQFKDTFLGSEKRDYVRATSCQRCVRAGGKHNDLENVGYTARHHTFFEMLGNFSFGDYFKEEAIQFAWEFLTSPQWMAIPAAKLTVTVYQEDDEAFAIWRDKVGLAEEKIIRIGDKGERYNSDNFWSMGDTGPCGPCTEIFYDHGEEIWGGLPGTPEEDGDRFIEIWNIVFMQYNRSADGTMTELPKPSVDTGMGLERIAAVMQGVHSNYEIDLFQALIKAAAEATGCTDLENNSLRVIADHIRSCAFLVADGVLPSNEGRGYVLRRIIRRAVRHGNKLGQKHAFFHKLVPALVAQMGEAYPELLQLQDQVAKVLLSEEEQFEKTLDKGMAVLDSALQQLSGTEIPGTTVFTLYDTYGFPVDLTNDIARERGLTLDMAGYEAAMEAQRQRARDAGAFKVDYSAAIDVGGETQFCGYDALTEEGRVVALYQDGVAVEELPADQEGVVILDRTPFYAESGGQVGDSGLLVGEQARFEVSDCVKNAGHHLHIGRVLDGSLKVGQQLRAEVRPDIRQNTVLNHSATHLLHAALRAVLGDHVQQKGSLVNSERLRFDFTHFEGLQAEQLQRVEALVNEHIRLNSEVLTELCDIETAQAKGAMALFGEKYGDEVRVLSMGEGFSMELCGGTHAKRTGDIGLFRIVSEQGIASGVRRIEAVTGSKALELFERTEQALEQLAKLTKSSRDRVVDKVESLVAHNRELEKELAQLKAKLASAASGDLLSQALDVAGIKVLAANLDGADPKDLRDTVDQLKNKLGSGIVLLGTTSGGKVSLVAGVTKDLTTRIKAGELMRHVAAQVGGKGGGRPDMAQGGGTDVAALPAALAAVPAWVQAQG